MWVLTVCKGYQQMTKSPLSCKELNILAEWLLTVMVGNQRGTDKSPLGQKPTRTKAHWTIAHWTKAHCLIWQGGQKPTSLEK